MRVDRRAFKGYATGYLFILPAILIIGLFYIYPSINLIPMSLRKYNLLRGLDAAEFIGLRNYVKIIGDGEFWNAFKNSFVFAVVVIPVQTTIALVMATFVNNKAKFAPFFRTVFFVPVIISFVVVSVFWKQILDPHFGLANSLLSLFGIPPQGYLIDPSQAMASVIFVSIWKSWGWFMIIFLAGLQGIPRQLYESASIDGASKIRVFFAITIPMIRRTILFVLVITTIDAIKIFAPVYIMTGGGPLERTDTVVHHVWKTAFRFNNMGYAAAMAVFLFLVVFAVTLFELRLNKRDY
jgi:multiple sugar transport system permease protein